MTTNKTYELPIPVVPHIVSVHFILEGMQADLYNWLLENYPDECSYWWTLHMLANYRPAADLAEGELEIMGRIHTNDHVTFGGHTRTGGFEGVCFGPDGGAQEITAEYLDANPFTPIDDPVGGQTAVEWILRPDQTDALRTVHPGRPLRFELRGETLNEVIIYAWGNWDAEWLLEIQSGVGVLARVFG